MAVGASGKAFVDRCGGGMSAGACLSAELLAMEGNLWGGTARDPSGNSLEFKALTNPANLFAKYVVGVTAVHQPLCADNKCTTRRLRSNARPSRDGLARAKDAHAAAFPVQGI